MTTGARTSLNGVPSMDSDMSPEAGSRPFEERSRTGASSIALNRIDVPGGRRKLDPNWVAALAADMAERGQLQPIEVVEDAGRYRLVYGAHRAAAARANGWVWINATVHAAEAFASAAEISLREIAENLMRRELSVLDRAVDVAAWREIFEAAQGAVRRGGDRRSRSKSQVDTLIGDEMQAAAERFAGGFSAAAQQALGMSRAQVFRALQIATIPAEVRDLIALHPIADNQSELLALAASGDQLRVAELIASAAATSVADAQAKMLGVTPPARPEPWARLADGFARLKPRDQNRFFELHEAAILTWQQQRGAK